MAMLHTKDADLHVEVDGSGDPVTVLAHGLTNSCQELAPFTPMLQGTVVRFCFRGHGHSSAPASGYRFADFARDLDAVATEYGATQAVGTSLGAGAICSLLEWNPDRFERMVFLLPAALDLDFAFKERFLRTAEMLEGKPQEEAIEAILSDPDRVVGYLQAPWRREFDETMWKEAITEGIARAIREVVEDHPVNDREQLRKVTAPVLLLCVEGDEIHPAELGRILADLMPNAELLVYDNDVAMIEAIPFLLQRVSTFLAGGS
jgi:pimeloyl-ACP methyl ester carboxylesterase